MKIAILGAGMSGLLAMKSAIEEGCEVDIYDSRRPDASQVVGLHYLHEDCGLKLKPSIIHNLVIGYDRVDKCGSIPEQYCKKIFGEGEFIKNSLVDLPAYNTVYNFREAYGILVKRFGREVTVMDIRRADLKWLQQDYDLIISTIPLPILYDYPCKYETMHVSTTLPKSLPMLESYPNITVYNVNESVNWYRTSRVHGHSFTEYTRPNPARETVPIKKIVTADVPIEALIVLDKVLPLGRWGEWNRKRLAHECYTIAQYHIRRLKGE